MSKGLLKIVVPIALIVVLAIGLPLMSGCIGKPAAEAEVWKAGYIGALATDVGRSAERGTEIAVDEINAAGGLLGRQIVLVKADATEDPTEGVKAYEYLAESQKVDFMVSGCIDDVSLGWMPRLLEFKIPMLDTWTSAIRCIEIAHDDYEAGGKAYFMPHMNDYDQGAEYVAFANDILAAEMGWETCVLYFEDTAYGGGVAEYVRDEIAPGAGIEVIGEVVYDIGTFDFAPVYAKIIEYDPDFIFHISSVNCIPPSAAYIELQVPIPILGVNVAACSAEFWDDMGGLAGGFCATMPPPTIGMDWDPVSQGFIDKYRARYTQRPIFSHFNGFNAYHGVYMMVEAAERAGGFKGEYLDRWVEEMEKTDLILWRYGGYERDDAAAQAAGEDADIKWQYYKFYGPEHPYTHSSVLDQTGENGRPGGCVMQWKLEKQDPIEATVGIIHPPRWRNTDYIFVPWIPEEKRGR
ncbi:MAG: ABC transporter substrate-binding protein [Dehalococcoidales bacterium]